MPRGENPNSRANLKPQSTRTKKEQREIAKKGGKASGEARRSYATLTQTLKEKCTPEVMEQLTDMLIKRAKQGNLKAYELLRDQVGEKPVDKINVTTVDDDAVDKLKKAIKQRRDADEAHKE